MLDNPDGSAEAGHDGDRRYPGRRRQERAAGAQWRAALHAAQGGRRQGEEAAAASERRQLGPRLAGRAATRSTPRDIKLGASNGRQTQVLAGDIAPGDLVATDIKAAGRQGRRSRMSDTDPHRHPRGQEDLWPWRSQRWPRWPASTCRIERRRIRRRHGPVGLRQVDLHEHSGLSGYADRGPLFLPRHRCRHARPRSARAAAALLHRLRVSGLQSSQAHDGARESRTAAALSRRRQSRTHAPAPWKR